MILECSGEEEKGDEVKEERKYMGDSAAAPEVSPTWRELKM